MSAPANIRTWVFDLDNTLYPAPALYDEIGVRMTDYIARKLTLATADAQELRERYFHQYGATVVGLARHHAIEAGDFLRHVHDADHSVLTPDLELRDLIAALPGRRIIYTNGGGGHAQRVLVSLGLDSVFDAVFDIESCGLAPKPQRESYDCFLAASRVEPTEAIFVEDTLRNLEPAHDLGFTTALVGPVHPEPKPAYVDHWAVDVKALLRGLLA
ncbi:pyrimidine 5'-nucleotidase [Terricaulis sp.]|uniref:pyrimidine 5'-nucleotidase n=1 Tax=Terricaulis sp. TaxID=2768686 RepID=UPI002AC4D372|nr:pyrimidine 5'-nucleotidase [Terricaulis sp.]MDZ4692535.1 pyrimidine 5'-nucleotidase [Terricaulis sp.]